MIFQSYRCTGNVYTELANPADLLGHVYLDHRDFFLSLDDLFLPASVFTISAFILMLNFCNKLDQDCVTLEGQCNNH